jgi:hypothetical protein
VCGLSNLAYEEVPNAPLRIQRIHSQVLHEPREAFVQPQVRPPLHRDQIAEPHVRQLVADGAGGGLLHAERRLLSGMNSAMKQFQTRDWSLDLEPSGQ